VLAHPSGDKSYEFDRVYAPTSTQEKVFEDTEPLVTSVLDGCVISYPRVQ
jgi:kinesin family protein C2/C3